jgi:putative ABC transport system substrate-binding protein
MRRREFIAGLGGAVAWPVAARGQEGERVRRIGVLTFASETGVGSLTIRRLLRDDLEHLGWREGRNLRLDFRFGDGDPRKTSAFAADLVQLAPDVIVTAFGAALLAVQQKTKTIPIVIAGAGDLGTFINPARPEGNVTGFTNAFASLGGKWLELLKEVAPNITRVLWLLYAVRPDAALYIYAPGGGYGQSIGTAARSLGVLLVAITVRDAASAKAAIEGFAAEPNGGLLADPGTFAIVPPDELSRLAAQYGLPAIYGVPLAANGGLMSYSADLDEIVHGVATYVDRLLRGAKVSHLPV